ncbi:FtsX-like permease family protein [Ruminococcus sp. NK3A76]|uniref:ABC transporter permease n=1 Tax=Ruminococcus sp. NK3A76 TaxID=877411 RepID=UPI0012EBB4FD|nr:FtsX-like permease family protein [Ruminococcus sp. NK3A76]
MNVVISALVICFSYGIYQNYNTVIEEGSSSNKQLWIVPTSSPLEKINTSVTTKMLIDTLYELDTNTLKNIKSIECGAILPTSAFDKMSFKFDFTYNGKSYHDNFELFSDEQYSSDKKIIAIIHKLRTPEAESISLTSLSIGEDWYGKNIGDSKTVDVDDEEFEIVNDTLTMEQGPLSAPITSFYSDTPLRLNKGGWSVYISFNTDLTRTQYDDIVNAVKICMGDNAQVPEMDISPVTEIFYYKTVIIISVFISFLAGLNFAVLYRFVLLKRIKTLTIFRLCGCTKQKMIRIYMTECMIVGLPLFALTELIYSKLILPALADTFEYITYAYSPLLYFVMFAIYAVSSFIVLFIMIVLFVSKRQITELKAGV